MKKKILFSIIMIASIGISWMIYSKRNLDKEAKSEYERLTISKGEFLEVVIATGEVKPQNRLALKPPIPGRIESVNVLEGDTVKKGEVVAWISSTERAALLDAASSKGPEELKKWQELYRPTPIMAPLDGIVISRDFEPGQSLTTADAIIVLSDKLIIKAYVDEVDLARIQLKQKAKVFVDAYPKHEIEAIVQNIAYEAKSVQNVTMYEIDMEPLNAHDFLRSGMSANITFIITQLSSTLLIPASAINSISENKLKGTVFINEQGETREINLGLTNGKFYQVLEGLNDQDVIWTKKLPELVDPAFQKNSPFGGGRMGGNRNSARQQRK